MFVLPRSGFLVVENIFIQKQLLFEFLSGTQTEFWNIKKLQWSFFIGICSFCVVQTAGNRFLKDIGMAGRGNTCFTLFQSMCIFTETELVCRSWLWILIGLFLKEQILTDRARFRLILAKLKFSPLVHFENPRSEQTIFIAKIASEIEKFKKSPKTVSATNLWQIYLTPWLADILN